MPAPPTGRSVHPPSPRDDSAFHAIPHPSATSSSVATTTGVRLPVDVVPSACLGAVTTLSAAGDCTPAVVLPLISQRSFATSAAPGVRSSATAPSSTGLGLFATTAGFWIRALVPLPLRLSSFDFRIPQIVPPIRLASSRLPHPLFRLILPEPASWCRLLLPFSPPVLEDVVGFHDRRRSYPSTRLEGRDARRGEQRHLNRRTTG